MGTPVPVVAVLSRAFTVWVEISARNWLLKPARCVFAAARARTKLL